MQIIIIGAGIAGLFACKKMHEKGHDVKILEAKNRIGGRILSKNFLKNTDDFLPLEMGAEEIHGQKSFLYKLLKKENIKLKKSRQKQDLYLWKTEEKTQLYTEFDLEEGNKDFQNLVHFYQKTLHEEKINIDTTVGEVAYQTELSHNAYIHLDTWLSNAYGMSIDKMKLASLRKADELWNAGIENFVLEDTSLSHFLVRYFMDILHLIHFEKNIIQIDYTTPNKITLTSPQNEVWEADKVIVSVPLSILKNKRINFTPPLPLDKQKALENLDIKRGVKVALRFEKAFWAKKNGSIYTHLGEYYAVFRTENTLMLLVLDKKADALMSKPKDERISFILSDLCEAFGNFLPNFSFQEAIFQDWGVEPYIEGAYSFAQKAPKRTRQTLAKPIENRLFFIGEATDVHCPATMHGAMNSGLNIEIED